MNIPTLKRLSALLLAVSAVTALPAIAQSVAAPRTAADVIKRINARNPALHTFQTGIHVQVRMTSFPFLSPHLDGNAYYKRPGKYEVVFTNAPSYAKGFNKLFADIADPNGWVADSNIAFKGTQTVDGRQYLVLSMTKKIYSDQIKNTVAYVDPSTFQVARMEWNYTNGGSIAMTQTFRNEAGFNVVSSQHVDVHYRVRAVADSSFDPYKTNVPVADSVFTGKN
jgi:outer membrane lipoprotein-sorting protein